MAPSGVDCVPNREHRNPREAIVLKLLKDTLETKGPGKQAPPLLGQPEVRYTSLPLLLTSQPSNNTDRVDVNLCPKSQDARMATS